jgi:hypothetical protein
MSFCAFRKNEASHDIHSSHCLKYLKMDQRREGEGRKGMILEMLIR